ncbi:ribosome small subunit-dependent GTPase A [Parablautia sp. Marseille-Q6255]|uniref:ribosome small subunit-dependent GTPase A n=1 Tax=Parablautia sp. Marseille-Q6255 TaxID=3039593 RepID=UPI0024BC5039|nr:ribosome small subunit-dependent GTPase A [Parablautia sp. Marseille-Q6255]
MQGKIIRGVGGFYYVDAADGNVYECRAKGIFRKNKIKPLVGDNVEISVLDETARTGNVDALLPRRNALIRPAVANVDQALVVFAAASPKPNLNLLDRFLISMQQQDIPVIICFNKMDIASDECAKALEETYRGSGYRICFASVARREGIEEIQALLEGKTTVAAGPSGVGKSSLTNELQPDIRMEVGEISRIERGRHTTRHTELIVLRRNTYFLDTPGFSSLYLQGIEYGELRDYFHEFLQYEPYCRFQGCMHLSEPDCAVKEALAKGRISQSRYENYVQLAQELRDKKKY